MTLTPKQRIAMAFSDLAYANGDKPFQTFGALGSFVPPVSAPTMAMSARSAVPVPMPQPRPVQPPLSLAPPSPTPAAPDPTNNPYGFADSPAYMGQGSTGYPLFSLDKLFGGKS